MKVLFFFVGTFTDSMHAHNRDCTSSSFMEKIYE